MNDKMKELVDTLRKVEYFKPTWYDIGVFLKLGANPFIDDVLAAIADYIEANCGDSVKEFATPGPDTGEYIAVPADRNGKLCHFHDRMYDEEKQENFFVYTYECWPDGIMLLDIVNKEHDPKHCIHVGESELLKLFEEAETNFWPRDILIAKELIRKAFSLGLNSKEG